MPKQQEGKPAALQSKNDEECKAIEKAEKIKFKFQKMSLDQAQE